MQNQSLTRSAVFAIFLVITFLLCWELILRKKGYKKDYDDGAELWAAKRAWVYEPSARTIVFIGSSRIKYDLDIETWEKLTGLHAIQLAMVASSPRALLADLSQDQKFKGKLIIDVTEAVFFNPSPVVSMKPVAGISYYKKHTPAQIASYTIGGWLESQLVLLNQNYLSINALLGKLRLTNRPGVKLPPDFPLGFNTTMYNRQSKMTDYFIADTKATNKVKAIWSGKQSSFTSPPLNSKKLNALFMDIKRNVDAIRARGGEVMFLRTPSSGTLFQKEQLLYPRQTGWDHLLAVTQTRGIYFKDYAGLSEFQCPENSHLQPRDAIKYTEELVKILKANKSVFSASELSQAL